jgi:hypothetical protein
MKLPRAGLLLELAANLLLPWLVWRLALPRVGETGALYASAAPPLVWSMVEFVRTRRVDALSLLVLGGIALSLVMLALGGDARILLVRESLAAGVIGLSFLVSLAFRRPLIFYLARATDAREREGGAARFEGYYEASATLRASLRLMTLVWGVGLTGENALRCWLAWHWPVERYLVVSPLLGYAIYGGLTAWTFWFRTRMRRQLRVDEQTGTRGDALRP